MNQMTFTRNSAPLRHSQKSYRHRKVLGRLLVRLKPIIHKRGREMSGSARPAVIVTAMCALWSLLFFLFGATSSGKVFYGKLASVLLGDVKGGVPVLTLELPVLVAGTASVLLNVGSKHRTSHTRSKLPPKFGPPRISLLIQQWRVGSGDLNFDRASFYWLLVPLVVHLLTNINRTLHGNELSFDEKLRNVSNSFANVAMVAMSFFLIPVARQSPILKLLNWSPPAAVRLHIWSGRIIIVGVIVHGGMHMKRLVNMSSDQCLLSMIFPPAPCWTLADTDFEPTCNDPDTECTCYHLFRNLAGVLGLIALLAIAATTVNYVRRNHYRVFYTVHVLAAPSFLILVILHWQRSILFVAPSLLYYVASSVPAMTEAALNRKDSGVKILSVKRIESRNKRGDRPCISLTMAASEESLRSYHPVQYVKLSVPEISSISHPFSINHVPGKYGEMCIIFRATGPFTRQLAHRLTRGKNLPVVHIDGFYGTTKRMCQVCEHDSVVLVAGGIGITTYLSLLHEISSVTTFRDPKDQSRLTKQVVLHWICRDQLLVDYVKEHYFGPICTHASEAGPSIRIIVHNTGEKLVENSLSDSADMERGSSIDMDDKGAPLRLSRFSVGSSITGNTWPFATFSSTVWIGLWAVWRLYMDVTAVDALAGRGFAAAAIVAISVLVALLSTWTLQLFDKVQPRQDELGLLESVERNGSGIEMESVEGGTENTPLVLASRNAHVDVDAWSGTVTCQEKTGRPSVHELLTSLDGVCFPALFVCGPKALAQTLRGACDERCQMRITSGTPHVAVYEETFEL